MRQSPSFPPSHRTYNKRILNHYHHFQLSSSKRDEISSLDKLLNVKTSSDEFEENIQGEDINENNNKQKEVRVYREITVELSTDEGADLSIRVQSASSRVICSTRRTPLGIVIEPTSRGVEVVEVTDIESALKKGDVIRAVSAMVPTMKYPKNNILMGGVGRPGFDRKIFTIRSAMEIREQILEEDDDIEAIDKVISNEFETCLKAIQSNARAGDYEVVVVVERILT